MDRSLARRETPLRALERPRFELVPLEGAQELAAHLPSGATVTVTCSPKQGIEETLLLCEALAERDFRPVPHLSARLVTGPEHLERLCRRMSYAGLREVFVVGGDVPEPAGPFPSSHALLYAMAELGYRFERVGIAGYPERHPTIPEEELWRALREKEPFATHLVTQLCFDPRAVLRWVQDVRRAGIWLPVYVGIPGAVDRSKLLRVSLKIGIGDSLRFLKGHGRLVAGLFGGSGPDRLVEELGPYVGDPEWDIAGCHLYTFNQVAETERWRRAKLRAG
jgi:methylenetetrahydrofolate reductase (NADPH)